MSVKIAACPDCGNVLPSEAALVRHCENFCQGPRGVQRGRVEFATEPERIEVPAAVGPVIFLMLFLGAIGLAGWMIAAGTWGVGQGLALLLLMWIGAGALGTLLVPVERALRTGVARRRSRRESMAVDDDGE